MRLLIVALLAAISYAQTVPGCRDSTAVNYNAAATEDDINNPCLYNNVMGNGKEVTVTAFSTRCGSDNLLFSETGIADIMTCAQTAQGLNSDTMYFSWRQNRGKCDIPSPSTMNSDCTTDVTTGVHMWTIYQMADPALADDVCGVPGGDGTSCLGCDRVANSGAVVDVCGVCGGNGDSCKGCDGVANSGAVVDVCGVCGGNGDSCDGCDGVAGSGAVVDECGICGGDGSSCAPTRRPGDDCFPYVQPMCHIQKILVDDEGSETDKETRFEAVGRHVKRVLRTNMMDDGSKPEAKWMWRQMKDIVKFDGYSRKNFWRLNKQFQNLVAWYNDQYEVDSEEENFMG